MTELNEFRKLSFGAHIKRTTLEDHALLASIDGETYTTARAWVGSRPSSYMVGRI